MGFTSVVELPLQLHPVDPDPFLDGVRSGNGELTTALLVELDPDELRARSRHAELAA